MAEEIEDEAAKAEYLQLQSLITKNEDYSFKDLTELQRNILCCVLTGDLVKSSSDLAKEILVTRNIASEHDQKQLTSQIIEAKISLLTLVHEKKITKNVNIFILVYKKWIWKMDLSFLVLSLLLSVLLLSVTG